MGGSFDRAHASTNKKKPALITDAHRCQLLMTRRGWISYQLSTNGYRLSELLNHFFKLRTEDSSIVTIKRDMEPIPFLAFGNESS